MQKSFHQLGCLPVALLTVVDAQLRAYRRASSLFLTVQYVCVVSLLVGYILIPLAHGLSVACLIVIRRYYCGRQTLKPRQIFEFK